MAFKLPSLNLFIYTFNQEKRGQLEGVKTNMIEKFKKIYENRLEVEYLFPIPKFMKLKAMIRKLNNEDEELVGKYSEDIKHKYDCSI